MRSPVSITPLGECNAITNRWFGESDFFYPSLMFIYGTEPSEPTIGSTVVRQPSTLGTDQTKSDPR